MKLQEACQQVIDGLLARWFAFRAVQLTADHLGAEVNELDPEADQQFHSSTARHAGNDHRTTIEESAEIGTLNRKPCDCIAQDRGD